VENICCIFNVLFSQAVCFSPLPGVEISDLASAGNSSPHLPQHVNALTDCANLLLHQPQATDAFTPGSGPCQQQITLLKISGANLRKIVEKVAEDHATLVARRCTTCKSKDRQCQKCAETSLKLLKMDAKEAATSLTSHDLQWYFKEQHIYPPKSTEFDSYFQEGAADIVVSYRWTDPILSVLTVLEQKFDNKRSPPPTFWFDVVINDQTAKDIQVVLDQAEEAYRNGHTHAVVGFSCLERAWVLLEVFIRCESGGHSLFIPIHQADFSYGLRLTKYSLMNFFHDMQCFDEKDKTAIQERILSKHTESEFNDTVRKVVMSALPRFTPQLCTEDNCPPMQEFLLSLPNSNSEFSTNDITDILTKAQRDWDCLPHKPDHHGAFDEFLAMSAFLNHSLVQTSLMQTLDPTCSHDAKSMLPLVYWLDQALASLRTKESSEGGYQYGYYCLDFRVAAEFRRGQVKTLQPYTQLHHLGLAFQFKQAMFSASTMFICRMRSAVPVWHLSSQLENFQLLFPPTAAFLVINTMPSSHLRMMGVSCDIIVMNEITEKCGMTMSLADKLGTMDRLMVLYQPFLDTYIPLQGKWSPQSNKQHFTISNLLLEQMQQSSGPSSPLPPEGSPSSTFRFIIQRLIQRRNCKFCGEGVQADKLCCSTCHDFIASAAHSGAAVVLLRGAGGSGKTSFCLAAMADDKWQGLHRFFLHLPEIEKPFHKGALNFKLCEQYDLNPQLDLAELKRHPAVLFLDSFDEIKQTAYGNDPHYGSTCNLILLNDLQAWCQLLVVITCRTERLDGYSPADIHKTFGGPKVPLFTIYAHHFESVHIKEYVTRSVQCILKEGMFQQQANPLVNKVSEAIKQETSRQSASPTSIFSAATEVIKAEYHRIECEAAEQASHFTSGFIKDLSCILGLAPMIQQPFLLSLVSRLQLQTGFIPTMPVVQQLRQRSERHNLPLRRSELIAAVVHHMSISGRQVSLPTPINLCHELAFKMLCAGCSSCTVAELSHLKALEGCSLESQANLLPQCPLRYGDAFDQAEEISFIHKMFMEFFVADLLFNSPRDTLRQCGNVNLRQAPEVLRFVADSWHRDPAAHKRVKDELLDLVYTSRHTEQVTSPLASNALTILNACRVPLSGFDLSNIHVPDE